MYTNFPIFGGFDSREELAFDSENLINLFMMGDSEGKKKFAFLGTPGLSEALVVDSGTAPSRAFQVYEGDLYGVFGTDVYRFTSPLVKSHIGSIATNTGYVSITANNGNQIGFFDGTAGYAYNISTGVFSQITSGFIGNPTNAVTLDGYTITPRRDSRTFQISALNDMTQWDSLDIAEIQAYSGEDVGVGLVNRRLYFFKTDSTEVWYNAGSTDFPFRRDNNLIFNFGCLTAASIASGFGYLFWLGKDADGVGSIMMTTGQVPQKISNESIDNLISQFTNPSDVSAYIYKDLGHIFYVINWDTDDTTLVYDVTMGIWHQFQMQETKYDPLVPFSGKIRHLGNCHAYFNNKHYIGSYQSPTIYEMSRNYATNNGDAIKRVRVCPHFFDSSYHMMQINSLQIDMQMGIGLSGSPTTGVDPKLYLRISRDGGNTFGNYHAASIGRIGNTKARAIFRRLGLARDFIAELSIFDPVKPIAILGGAIDYEVLSK